MIMSAKVDVHNVPQYAKTHDFWVVRLVDGELWFYGAWNDTKEAERVAREVHGLVVQNT